MDSKVIIGAVLAVAGVAMLFLLDGVWSTVGCVLIAAGAGAIGYSRKKKGGK